VRALPAQTAGEANGRSPRVATKRRRDGLFNASSLHESVHDMPTGLHGPMRCRLGGTFLSAGLIHVNAVRALRPKVNVSRRAASIAVAAERARRQGRSRGPLCRGVAAPRSLPDVAHGLRKQDSRRAYIQSEFSARLRKRSVDREDRCRSEERHRGRTRMGSSSPCCDRHRRHRVTHFGAGEREPLAVDVCAPSVSSD